MCRACCAAIVAPALLFMLSAGCARTDLTLPSDDRVGVGGGRTEPVAATAGASTVGVGGGAATGGSITGGGAGVGAPSGAGTTGAPDDTAGEGGACQYDCTAEPEPEPEPEPADCDYCTENQVCDRETHTCRCTEGYAELPGGSGLCVPDPCAGVTCGGKGACSVAENDQARCDCEGEWSGLECNQRWHTIKVPPFVQDMAFDADGNGWFVTTQGLLFWDFNGTPDNTADDSWQVFGEFDGFTYDFQSVVIDSRGAKWVLAGRLHRLDDHGTPTNTADDTWENYELTYWRSPGTRRIVLDGDGRLWWVGQAGAGVKVLPAAELDAGPPEVTDARWVSLFTTELVHDVGVSKDAVWLAAESGVYHVSLGETLADETDDIWTDFSDAPGLGGQAVSSIELDSAATSVWFTTRSGIVRLSHGEDPLNETTNTWTGWVPQVDAASVDIGPVMAVAADGAVWLRSPQGAAVRVARADTGNDSLTFYHPSSRPEYAFIPSNEWVHSLVVDDRGDKWLTWGGSLLHFDDGGTATDTTDDRWTRLGRAALSESVMELFPVLEGGVWLTSHRGNPTSTPGCSGTDTLYYVDVGALTNSLDDAWIRHPLGEALSSCFRLLGPDASGHLWVKDQPPLSPDGAWHLLDVKTTPADPSDDTWTAWTAEDASSFSADVAVVDPVRGLWIGDYLFSYGASLSDSDDDSWWQLGAKSPRSMALDAKGGRWFGYDEPVLRYLDDGTTPELAADDRWVEYSSTDGLPMGSIHAVQMDASNRLWILGNRWQAEPQLCRLDPSATPLDKSDDAWTCFTTSDGLNDPDVTAIAIAKAGDLWVGTGFGLQYLELDP